MHGTFRDLHPQAYLTPRDLSGEGAEVEEEKRDGGRKSPLSGEASWYGDEANEGPAGGDRKKRDRKHDDKRSQE